MLPVVSTVASRTFLVLLLGLYVANEVSHYQFALEQTKSENQSTPGVETMIPPAQASSDVIATTEDDLYQSNMELIRPRPRNLRLVLVGDSVTRYQYLSLAYFLKYGSWWNPHQRSPNFVYAPSYHHPQHTDLDWAEYNFQTNRLLYPMELCDCQRKDNFILERRYFWDPIRNNTLVYMHLNGKETTAPRRGYFGSFAPSQVFGNWSKRLPEAEPKRAFRLKRHIAWEHDSWMDVVRFHVGALGLGNGIPVVLNAGLHPHDLTPRDLQQVQNDTGLRILWKTTTYRKREMADLYYNGTLSLERQGITAVDNAMCHQFECFNVTWTSQLRHSQFLDQLHFAEPVYRIMNEQLLMQLQLWPTGYAPLHPSRLFPQPQQSHNHHHQTQPTTATA